MWTVRGATRRAVGRGDVAKPQFNIPTILTFLNNRMISHQRCRQSRGRGFKYLLECLGLWKIT